MVHYIALIHKDNNSDFGVSFPDFPGLVTAGCDLDEARAMAEEALSFHIDGLLEDGNTLPAPSSLETVMQSTENRDGVAILVSHRAAPTKSVRVNITLPEDILHEIDTFSTAHGLTRSGFLARAARREMAAS
jgi:predicted RNase H-like HicB family nuclease